MTAKLVARFSSRRPAQGRPSLTPHDLSTTAILLDRAKGGDESARNELAERVAPRLRRLASGRLPRSGIGVDGPEDVVQETLIRAFNSMERFVPRCDGAFFLYLRRILINVIADSCRRANRTVPTVPLEDELSRSASPVEEAIGRETWELYQRKLEGLPENQREAIVLFVEFGMSFREIADALDAPSSNAVRMQIKRGLGRLAESMDVPE